MIVIKKNPNGDTRTAPKDVSFEQFQEANDMHRHDVAQVMMWFAGEISHVGHNHDFTKNLKSECFIVIFSPL